jgi:putative transposase
MSRRKEPSNPAALLDQLLAGSDAGAALQDGRLLDSMKKALAERALNCGDGPPFRPEHPG